MYDRILVPVDFEASRSKAIDVACKLARWSGGSVTVLHVIETLDLPYEELADFYQRLEAEAHDKLEALVKAQEGSGVTVEKKMTFGKRAPEIVREAEEEDYDLIVLGSHRVNPTDPEARWMTISHQVGMFARCPVLFLR